MTDSNPPNVRALRIGDKIVGSAEHFAPDDEIFFAVNVPRQRAEFLARMLDEPLCSSCGREEAECSADPCAGLLAQREYMEGEDQGHHDTIRALAGEQYLDTRIEVDADGIVSEGEDNGAYVAAWIWVDFADTDLDKDNETIDEGDDM